MRGLRVRPCWLAPKTVPPEPDETCAGDHLTENHIYLQPMGRLLHASRVQTPLIFVIAFDAPRRARRRDTATFSSKKRRAPASTRQNGPFCAFPSSHRHVCVSTWGVLRGEPVLPRGLGLLFDGQFPAFRSCAGCGGLRACSCTHRALSA